MHITIKLPNIYKDYYHKKLNGPISQIWKYSMIWHYFWILPVLLPITWQTSIYYIAPTIIPRHRSHSVCLMLMKQTFRVAVYVNSYTSKPFQKLINGKVRIIGEIKSHQNVSNNASTYFRYSAFPRLKLKQSMIQ